MLFEARVGLLFGGELKEQAVLLASILRPFNEPSVRGLILAFENWSEAETPRERLKIAEDMQRHKRFTDLTPKHYRSLVVNPEFLAGIIDFRGGLYRTTEVPEIYITTRNVALREALKERYGGEKFRTIFCLP